MNKSESIGKLAEALSKTQAALKGAIKDCNNPFFGSQYADLSSVWEACREPLTKNGLSVVQSTDVADTGVIIETMLCHTSGEWISGRLKMLPTKTDPQGVGSAITYGRRYALAAMVGIAPEDDDAESAMGRPKDAGKKTETAKPPTTSKTPPASDEVITDVKATLKEELYGYCNGDPVVMAQILKEISVFGEPGKENWIKDIDKASEKWCGKALGNLRKLPPVSDAPPHTDEDVPW